MGILSRARSLATDRHASDAASSGAIRAGVDVWPSRGELKRQPQLGRSSRLHGRSVPGCCLDSSMGAQGQRVERHGCELFATVSSPSKPEKQQPGPLRFGPRAGRTVCVTDSLGGGASGPWIAGAPRAGSGRAAARKAELERLRAASRCSGHRTPAMNGAQLRGSRDITPSVTVTSPRYRAITHVEITAATREPLPTRSQRCRGNDIAVILRRRSRRYRRDITPSPTSRLQRSQAGLSSRASEQTRREPRG